METIYIACTTDTNYIQHVGVMLCSLFENNKQNTFSILLIIDFKANKKTVKLSKLIRKYGHSLHIIPIDGKQVEGLILSAHATKAVYYRLLIPSLIDINISKILYLDSDIIIKRDIRKLWQTDVKHYALAAVAEPLFDRHQLLGLPNLHTYFNSGVMVINLDYWRNNKVSERVIHYIHNNPEKILYWDQDGLNVVLQDKWLELPPVWNQQTQFFDESIVRSNMRRDWIEVCKIEPAIIHYSSKFKPWHHWCDHPLKGEYYYYLKLSPWKNFHLPEHTMGQQIKQLIKKAMNKVMHRKIFEVYV